MELNRTRVVGSEYYMLPSVVGLSMDPKRHPQVAILDVVPLPGAGAAASGAVGVIVDGHGFLGDGELALGSDLDSGAEG